MHYTINFDDIVTDFHVNFDAINEPNCVGYYDVDGLWHPKDVLSDVTENEQSGEFSSMVER